MRLVAILSVAAVLSWAGAVRAQVIGGESTYEDNFAHTPPPEAAQSGSRDASPPVRTAPARGRPAQTRRE